MKRCSCCKEEKSETEFHRNKTRGDGLRAICKDCARKKQREWTARNRDTSNASSKRWYDANPDRARAVNKRNYAKVRGKLIEYKRNYLLSNPCSVCGESRLACLEFHHTRPEDKERGIAQIRTIAKFMEEVKKCVVVCANCHAIIHYTGVYES